MGQVCPLLGHGSTPMELIGYVANHMPLPNRLFRGVDSPLHAHPATAYLLPSLLCPLSPPLLLLLLPAPQEEKHEKRMSTRGRSPSDDSPTTVGPGDDVSPDRQNFQLPNPSWRGVRFYNIIDWLPRRKGVNIGRAALAHRGAALHVGANRLERGGSIDVTRHDW